MKSVQIRSSFWSIFSRIRTEFLESFLMSFNWIFFLLLLQTFPLCYHRVASDGGLYWRCWDILVKFAILGLCWDSWLFKHHTGRYWDFLKLLQLLRIFIQGGNLYTEPLLKFEEPSHVSSNSWYLAYIARFEEISTGLLKLAEDIQ